MLHKALLIPINSRREIFIQDRRGHKKPDWGFFGGGMEENEEALDTVIREASEELELNLKPEDLKFIGTFIVNFAEIIAERHCYLYHTDQTTFTVREGKGGVWLAAEEVAQRLDLGERFDVLWKVIETTQENN